MRRLVSLLVIGVAAILVLLAQDRPGTRTLLGIDPPERPPIPAGSCTDGDGYGYCVGDDCNVADPNSNVDCIDADGDGFCPPYDCDDGIPDVTDSDLDGVPNAGDNFSDDANQDQADVGETRRIISDTDGGAQSVLTADIDGDSDIDVLSASSTDDKIAWYANR